MEKIRAVSEPIAYRFGGAYFCELPFFVNKHVLIPRFDTEILVEAVIKTTPSAALRRLPPLHTSVRERRGGEFSVLDLCTGSGCIAVVLAKHGYKVTASDISGKAVKIAKQNAKLHDVDIEFIKSDLFEKIGGKYDAIVCNPPYIKTNEIGKWDKSILFEPQLALDGGADGLYFYRKISERAAAFLSDNGHIFFEIGCGQSKAVKTILEQSGFCDINIVKDKQGLDRVIHGRKISGNTKKI